MKILNSVILVLCVLFGVAFLTLLERKVLSYIQIRKGPNKVGYQGILQPFSDAVKLFTKEQIVLSMVNFIPFYMSPVMSLFFALLVWVVFPCSFGLLDFNMGVLFFFCILSVSVYSMMSAGWSSNCKYSMLGGLRAVAQTISYEVSLALILLCYIILIESFNLKMFSEYQKEFWFLFLALPLSLIWLVSSLAETNRTPFDFSEGESELVSGFNTEYGSGGFALIFMAEYASILFMSMLFSLIFLGGNVCSVFFYMKIVVLSFVFIWVRGTLPRLRYDKLMYMAWKSLLPVVLNYLFLFCGFKMLVFCLMI
uniref:NADH dehydrogenase subunit 1 n=1 Tax=Pisidia serratifrons TaxID=761937 RepID=UPI00226D071E|nr:NADH dehydrogenase subunit 1 [Pisidia serratifrons]UZA47092.1 NADH dehydrogenase subunit 1 [Pisidia serratifrons]